MNSSSATRRFEGHVVLVTGAANGIGQAVATAFVGEGATVYGLDVDTRGLEKTGDALGRRFVGLTADVADADHVARSVQQALAPAQRIDVLVNNAGINMGKRIAELEIADWDRVFDTNLKSVYLMCRAVWPTFERQRSGNIVNIASVMGQVGGVGAPAYCSTKAGIIMLSRCLAKDGARYGIRVNSVCPGYIDTPIMDRVLDAMPDPAKARQELLARMPLGRLGGAGEIGAAILFLASADAAYISGTELTIDGAVTATQID
ncbi:MAG TPA: glucose 1-dehydrogenase [Steroidobacteraceae bacterium]|jgi:3-oxoacyl-[acyl-carrier protein] reductase